MKFSYQPFAFGSAVIAITITGFLVPGPKNNASPLPLSIPHNVTPGTTSTPTTTTSQAQQTEVLGTEIERSETPALRTTATAIHTVSAGNAPQPQAEDTSEPSTTATPTTTASPPPRQQPSTTAQRQTTTTTRRIVTTEAPAKEDRGSNDPCQRFPACITSPKQHDDRY